MSALDIQIGGEHYKNAKIQPIQYIEANGLGFLEGCVVKRITRHDKPTGKGRQDIEKAIHELQLLLEFRYQQVPSTTERGSLSSGPVIHSVTNPSGEDIYAEFAARMGTADRNVGKADELSDALARQVSAGKIDTDFDESTLEDEYSAYAEPAAAMDDDGPRMQAIGQNGNDGEHYDDPWTGAPEWAKYKAQDADGRWYWYQIKPIVSSGSLRAWLRDGGEAVLYDSDEPNPSWRDTLITRT